MPWHGIWNRHQKKALEERSRLGEGHRLTLHRGDYRIDGEIGRFTFALYDVIDADERAVFEGRSLFPPRQGRQWYQTYGFKELALLYGRPCPCCLLNGVAQRSYRQMVR